MKLRILAFRNPSAIYRYQNRINKEQDDDGTDNDAESTEEDRINTHNSGIPKDIGNRLPTGGRTGNPKIDKFQGYRIPPMY